MPMGRMKNRRDAIIRHDRFLKGLEKLPKMNRATFLKQFGKRLAELRRLEELSIAELAKITAISPKRISAWEKGRAAIDVFCLFKIVQAISPPPDDFSYRLEHLFEFADDEFCADDDEDDDDQEGEND